MTGIADWTILGMKLEDLGLWASSFLRFEGGIPRFMHYTNYTRVTQNGDILTDVYVDLCEKSCKMVL